MRLGQAAVLGLALALAAFWSSPPPEPEPARVTVEGVGLGDSLEQVVAVLGQPDRVVWGEPRGIQFSYPSAMGRKVVPRQGVLVQLTPPLGVTAVQGFQAEEPDGPAQVVENVGGSTGCWPDIGLTRMESEGRRLYRLTQPRLGASEPGRWELDRFRSGNVYLDGVSPGMSRRRVDRVLGPPAKATLPWSFYRAGTRVRFDPSGYATEVSGQRFEFDNSMLWCQRTETILEVGQRPPGVEGRSLTKSGRIGPLEFTFTVQRGSIQSLRLSRDDHALFSALAASR